MQETCILLGVMLLENTERPETVDVGANMLAGANSWEMLREQAKCCLVPIVGRILSVMTKRVIL